MTGRGSQADAGLAVWPLGRIVWPPPGHGESLMASRLPAVARRWVDSRVAAARLAGAARLPDRSGEHRRRACPTCRRIRPSSWTAAKAGSRTCLTLCRRLSANRSMIDRRCSTSPRTIPSPPGSPAFRHGADAVVGKSATADELLAQIRVLERWQKARDHWLGRAADAQQFSQQLQHAYQQIDLDLQMASGCRPAFCRRRCRRSERSGSRSAIDPAARSAAISTTSFASTSTTSAFTSPMRWATASRPAC